MMRHWTERLSDYIDDDLDAHERVQLEQHLRECAQCAADLARIEAVVRQARALRAQAPERDLWPGIAAHISSAGASSSAGGAGEARAPGRPPLSFPVRTRTRLAFSIPQLVAAGIVLMLVSATSVWLALSSTRSADRVAGGGATGVVATPSPAETAFETEIVAAAPASEPVAGTSGAQEQRLASERTGSGTRPAPRAAGSQVRNVGTPVEQPGAGSYDSAVTELQEVLRAGRAQLDPRTVRALEDNLRVIDQAIAASREALAQDSASIYLNDHLARNMQRKLELLRRASAIVSGQS